LQIESVLCIGFGYCVFFLTPKKVCIGTEKDTEMSSEVAWGNFHRKRGYIAEDSSAWKGDCWGRYDRDL